LILLGRGTREFKLGFPNFIMSLNEEQSKRRTVTLIYTP